MKIRELRAFLAGVEDDTEIWFSQDEELNGIYPRALLTDLGKGRVALVPFGEAEEPEFNT